MTQYTRPDSLPAWAESGDKVQPTNAEIQIGWPETSIPPSRQRFNWILGWLAQGVRYLLQLGVPEWAATETYAAGARVQYSGVTYKALASSSNITPGTDATKWERWGFLDSELLPRVDRLLSKSVAGGVDVTLTAGEADNGTLIFTGLLTANINVILPNAARRWVVQNNTSGSFTLSVKTSAGTAIQIPQSSTKASLIYCDGATNVRFAGTANDASIQNVSFTATAGQTSFSVTYTLGTVFMVTRNGSSVPFTASNGTTVVISAASAGDAVNVFIASGFTVAGAMNKSGDTATGPLAGPSPSIGDSSTLYATTAFVAGTAIGVGQTWQNVTGSRASGTTYTNLTGRPIQVSVTGGNSTSALLVTVGGVTIANMPSGAGQGSGCYASFIVPAGAAYVVTGSFNVWAELR